MVALQLFLVGPQAPLQVMTLDSGWQRDGFLPPLRLPACLPCLWRFLRRPFGVGVVQVQEQNGGARYQKRR